MKDCCYESIGERTYKRLGRAKFVCDKCGGDVTLALVYIEQMDELTK